MRAVLGEALPDEALLIRRYEPGDEEAVRDLHESASRAVGAYAEGHEEEQLDADVGTIYLEDGVQAALRLDTTVSQQAARALYEKNGYREASRGKSGPSDRIFYEKEPAQ